MPKINNLEKRRLGLNPVIVQLLYNRNIRKKEEIEEFLNPDYIKYSHDPFLFENMEKAVSLIIDQIKKGNLIIVYGDYDADGVTATALLVEVLTIFKAKVKVYIPDRSREGYGLNRKAIDRIVKLGAKLIITVDNGIRNKAEVDYAKKFGLEVVVTDHHEAPLEKNGLPDCLVINPIIDDYPFKSLAGVGVAFKLAKALIYKSKLPPADQKRLEEKIMDLVAVGTIADCVSLIGENRVLACEGLKVLDRQKRLGIKELIAAAQIKLTSWKRISSWNVAWQIAPRINSAGRLDHANTAYELLTTKDKDKAKSVALSLNNKNSLRQKITDEIVETAKAVIEREMVNEKILILISPSLFAKNGSLPWPEGVIGLVASRLVEQYFRPVLVITETDSEIRGSGRSIEKFDITSALEQVKEYLTKFGGHAQACGFSLKDKNSLAGFIKGMKRIAYKELKDIDFKRKLLIDAELSPEDIGGEIVLNLEKFEPFGEDNPRPVFLTRNLRISDIMKMGVNGQHLKFRLNNFWALGFNQSEKWDNLRVGDKIDLVYNLEMNEFNGRSEVQLKILDIKMV